MKRSILALATFATLAVSPAFSAPESEDEVAARNAALLTAGAWSANDGFKLRDGHWSGTLQPGKSQLIQVNLFAGNEYWFTLAAVGKAKKVLVSIFDETGKPIPYDPYANGATVAAGFSPEASGPYLIKVEELEGEAGAFCLIYSYK